MDQAGPSGRRTLDPGDDPGGEALPIEAGPGCGGFFYRDDEPEPGNGGDHGIRAHVSLPGKGIVKISMI